MKHRVIVVGGGHAGVEAASAAKRQGAEVILVTMTARDIGTMSCNPAIGGVGKGHLVREVDALGGVMALAGDSAGIQYRLLNSSKGPAVQGPRAQMDRRLYRSAVQDAVRRLGIEVIEAQVRDIIVDRGVAAGVVTEAGDTIRANAVVLTTGTFLRGTIHIGDHTESGGRVGESAANELGCRLYDMGLRMGRLKTGTPPRLDGRTIAWDRLDAQPGDDRPTMLSFLNDAPAARQVDCAITETNEATHDVIRRNLHRSAMYSGNISGKGPRYCPSIEDKIGRFPDKTSHQVFLEPEGLDDHTIYPNGISTSLPVSVQEEYVRTLTGLENVSILQPGYAIEYDYVDPRSLNESLELLDLPGLWLAGQINGTTGYEEAAAQGLVAGLNAARRCLEMESVIFSRASSYIGVLINDLTIRGVTEPYRMFTSRAEFRLSLRADNADQRLTPLAASWGILDDTRLRAVEWKSSALDAARAVLSRQSFTAREARGAGIQVSGDGARRTAMSLLSIPGVEIDNVIELEPEVKHVAPEILAQIARECIYLNYVERQSAEVERLRRDEARAIPEDFDIGAIHGLSSELREKLRRSRPTTIASAQRIEGMTPAAMNALLLALRARERRSATR